LSEARLRNPTALFLQSVWMVCLLLPLLAQGSPEDPCPNAQNQMELNACFSRAAADTEHRLSEVYAKTLSKLQKRKDPAAATLLRRAQVRWEAYRAAQCNAVSKLFEGGSSQGMQRDGCRSSLAEQRIQALNSMTPE
jgi:uncharacterized protein YecT (DUF1311 family)